MNAHRTPIDPSLMNLDGGIFETLPREVVPLEAFRLESYEEPVSDDAVLLVRRRRHDSLTPSALDAADVSRIASPRRTPWAVSLAAVAGAVLAVGGALHNPWIPPAPAARVERAPAIAAPALAAAPAPEAAVEKAAPVAPAAVAAVPRAVRPTPARPAATPAPVAPPAPAVASTADFDRAAVAGAVARAGQRANACGDEGGTLNVPVTLTFSPSGRVTMARVNGGPLVGTPAGGCLAAALRGAAVPAFAGDPVTVNTTVRLH